MMMAEHDPVLDDEVRRLDRLCRDPANGEEEFDPMLTAKLLEEMGLEVAAEHPFLSALWHVVHIPVRRRGTGPLGVLFETARSVLLEPLGLQPGERRQLPFAAQDRPPAVSDAASERVRAVPLGVQLLVADVHYLVDGRQNGFRVAHTHEDVP